MILRVFVGAIAALAGWMIMEPSAPQTINDARWDSWEFTFVAVLGLLIGGGLGSITGYLTGGKAHTLRGLGLGALLGVVGIRLGSSVGGSLSAGFFGANWVASGNLAITIPARMVALTPIGALLGLAIGISTLSPQRAKFGLIGGALAGGVGGGLFDVIGAVSGTLVRAARQMPPPVVAETGSVSRATYAIILGAGIGLFISLVEALARNAWLRQELGRNENREWPLYSDVNVIGRSETATVPIFSDPTLQPYHATIARGPGGYVITDNGGGIVVNGQPTAQAPLVSGSQIQLGNTRLVFMLKGGHAPVYAAAPSTTTMAAAPMQYGAPIPQATVPTQVMAPAAQPGITILATDGPLNGQRFPITFPIEVGRTCPTIPMNFDSMASRRHASLAPAPGGILVTDLGSTNGTFVNGNKVSQVVAGPGQTIKIGSTTFRVE